MGVFNCVSKFELSIYVLYRLVGCGDTRIMVAYVWCGGVFNCVSKFELSIYALYRLVGCGDTRIMVAYVWCGVVWFESRRFLCPWGQVCCAPSCVLRTICSR